MRLSLGRREAARTLSGNPEAAFPQDDEQPGRDHNGGAEQHRCLWQLTEIEIADTDPQHD